jgi:predicted neuraminidase
MAAHAADGKEDLVQSPKEFEKSCEAAGGRVDFVFGKDRPFKSCHASTLVQAPNGDLLCAWFGGTEESHPDVAIWMSRFSEGKWSKPFRAAKVMEQAHWNPVLFRDADNVILFFKVGVDVPNWRTYWQTSKDNGATWSEAVELVPGDVGGRGPVKNKPIVLSDGTWVAPASVETKERWDPFADRSEDKGKTWTRTEFWPIDKATLTGIGAIQPTFWEDAPGKVHALMRTGAGRVWRSDSEDGGKTWAPVHATDLPNNNSGLDLVRLEDGRLVLLYNPVGENWGSRTPLDLAVSTDNGATWKTIAHLEDNPDKKSEYSYPSIIATKEGVALSYTWLRDRVRCWQIPESLLK